MEGPLTSSPSVDGHIMKKASKAFGSSPRTEMLKMKCNKRINSFLPPLLFHSGRDLQAKLWQHAITTAIFYSRSLTTESAANQIYHRTKLSLLSLSHAGVENCLSSLNAIALHWIDPLNLLWIRDSEDSAMKFYGKHIRKIKTHKRAGFNHSEMNSMEIWSGNIVCS